MKKLLKPLLISWLAFVLMPLHAQLFTEQSMKFAQALELIRSKYVDTVNDRQLTETAIIGMMKELDPHSSYMTAKEVKEMEEPLQGNFEGTDLSPISTPMAGLAASSPLARRPATTAPMLATSSAPEPSFSPARKSTGWRIEPHQERLSSRANGAPNVFQFGALANRSSSADRTPTRDALESPKTASISRRSRTHRMRSRRQ